MAVTTSTPGGGGPNDEGSTPGTTPETAINSCAAPLERSTVSPEMDTTGTTPAPDHRCGDNPAVLSAAVFPEPARTATGAQVLFYALTETQERTDRATQLLKAATEAAEAVVGPGGEKVMTEIRKTVITVTGAFGCLVVVIMLGVFVIGTAVKANTAVIATTEAGIGAVALPAGSLTTWWAMSKAKRNAQAAGNTLRDALVPHAPSAASTTSAEAAHTES